MNLRLGAMAAVLSLALTACAHTPEIGGAPGITVLDLQALPAPTGIDPNSNARPYLLGPGDELLVDVVGIEGLDDRKISLDGSGRVSIPLAGVIEANGLTAAELEATVLERMRAGYVRTPIVSVNLSEARSRRVTVDGEVERPGAYPVVGRMTLMQAVATAQGTAEFARLQDVVVFRTVGDQRMVALYNLAAIRRGAYVDPEIFADDIVVVGESGRRRMFQTLIQAGTLLVGPIIALIQRN
jgi:polysaccharide biosynthesis/export protein